MRFHGTPDGNADAMAPKLEAPNPTTGVVVGSLGSGADGHRYAVVDHPVYGVVSVWPTGGFIYTPDPRTRLAAYRSGQSMADAFTVTVTDADGSVTEVGVRDVPIHPALAAVVATIPVGDRPSTATLDPADARLYVTHEDESVVSVIDTTTYTVIEALALNRAPTSVVFSPNGALAYLTHLDGEVLVVDVDSLAVVGTLPAPPPTAVTDRDRAIDDAIALIGGATDLQFGDTRAAVAVNAAGTCTFAAHVDDGTVSVIKFAVPLAG